ncbi:restriction endonuclease [Streptomyces bobili]|uniref:restriction endonuclease n=1 Tax=Streptomyces bobili TaxID=67280 RepID=UPI003F4DCF67
MRPAGPEAFAHSSTLRRGGPSFEHHVAELLRRDGCTEVVVRQARTDRGIDIALR